MKRPALKFPTNLGTCHILNLNFRIELLYSLPGFKKIMFLIGNINSNIYFGLAPEVAIDSQSLGV